MIEINFREKDDARKFHLLLLHHIRIFHIEKSNILFFEDQETIRVMHTDEKSKTLMAVQKAFFEFIVKIKLNSYFRMVLKEHYYFEDEEEQQQILYIIQSILDGKRMDLASLIDDLNINHQLEKAIEEVFHNHTTFSFDSFVKFRMRPFLKQLDKYVEISIDEYKMEQEYQVFIQTLREFLKDREAKLEMIHLLMKDDARFFNEHFCEIKRNELTKMIDRKLLSNHPVYVDSVTIAPLLSLAPAMIHLYTNDFEQPLVRTICNIFEERVHLYSIKEFEEKSQGVLCTANETKEKPF